MYASTVAKDAFWYTPNAGSSLIAFREWATDLHFYERLVHGDEDAATIFRRAKDLIDREA